MFWWSHNIQLLKFRVEFRVEFIGKRIHFSVILGVFEAKFYTNKNPETPANKGKTARMSGFHVGASNRNRTRLKGIRKYDVFSIIISYNDNVVCCRMV